MKKIWIHKASSFADMNKFEKNYYLNMPAKERLDMMQYLRELHFKWKGRPSESRKRLQRVIKVVQ